MVRDLVHQIVRKHLPGQKIRDVTSVSGGCINQTYKVSCHDQTFFLKVNSSLLADMFEKEIAGLDLLRRHSGIVVPEVVASGTMSQEAYLLLSWIEADGREPHWEEPHWKEFGAALARQHQVSHDYFGLDHDNYIGKLHQSNQYHQRWADFFIQERLEPQIQLARDNTLIDYPLCQSFDRLYSKLPDLVPEEPPALLHGDLWSGNFLFNHTGKVSFFDPAVYYGHRETELAFTQLFGGFSPRFYAGYTESYPLEEGFDGRMAIHNLYPLLVHVNLFGGSYLSGIKQTLDQYT